MSDWPTLADVPLPWQQAAWASLAARLVEGRLAHGLMIAGQAGTGKGLFANAFARLALCREPRAGNACGQCSSCVRFEAGTHPDFSHVTFEEREARTGEEPSLKSSISVEQMRELIAALQLSSHQRGRKVALIEPAEGMSIAAANSLLKTLEEPPAETLLILVSTAPGRLPATVRSRCQAVAIASPERESALGWLGAQRGRPDWAVLLALSGGAPLAALALADSGIEERRRTFLEGMLRLKSGEANPVQLAAQPKDRYPDLLRLLWSFVSDLILIRCGGGERVVNRDQLPLLQKAAEGIHLRSLYAFLDAVQAAIQALDTSANRELLFAVLLSDWAGGLEEIRSAPLAAGNAWGLT